MNRSFVFAVIFVALLASMSDNTRAQASLDDGRDFAEGFRAAEPFLVRDIVVSAPTGPNAKRVFLLTEPPALAYASRASWIPDIFGEALIGHTTYEHRVGFDGFLRDIVIESTALEPPEVTRIVEAIHEVFFGTSYKAAYRSFEPKSWNVHRPGPRRVGAESLEVSAASVHDWLYGKEALSFSSDPFDMMTPSTAGKSASGLPTDRAGVYYSDPAGLVVLMVPRERRLNDALPHLRRFVVDTDTLLGAVAAAPESQWLMLLARERTTRLDEMQPLRTDTILTLAASGSRDLAQSYQRTAPLAGSITDPKLLTALHPADAVAEFVAAFASAEAEADVPPEGWLGYWRERLDYLRESYALSMTVDWAPILLSRELTHTEYGQLLNITDQMLKSWSMANRINYVEFPYPTPYGNPDAVGLHTRLQRELDQEFSSLTFNWNTAGFGSWTDFGDVHIFTQYRTGSLPTSYFPDDGSFVIEGAAEEIIKKAEDDYWKFFSSLRDPYLSRAAQYAALHIIFQSVPVKAERTELLVSEEAYLARWDGFVDTVAEAISDMVRHAEAGTHPLDGALPISTMGLNLVLDHDKNCTRSIFDGFLWYDERVGDQVAESAAQLGGVERLAGMLVDPEKANNDFYASMKTEVDAFNQRSASLNEQIDVFTARLGQCNQTGTCSGVQLDSMLKDLVAEQDALALEDQRLSDIYERFYAAAGPAGGLADRIAAFGNCSAAWAAVVDGVPPAGDAVYRTPGIVVSNDDYNIDSVGGHNLDGRSVRVLADDGVARGSVAIDAESGIIRLNPAEMGSAQTVARTFERDYKRFVSGDPQFQTRVIGRIEAALTQDVRAIQAFDTLALNRSGTALPGARGLRIEATQASAQVQSSHVLTRPQAVALDARKAEEIVAALDGDATSAAIRTLETGAIELSWPGGRPPVAILTSSRADLHAAIDQMVAYVANSRTAPSGVIRIVDIDGAMSLGDMAAIKYTGIGRPAAGGGGAGLPPRGVGPVAAGGDGGMRGGGFFFGRGSDGKKISVGFFHRRGNAYEKLLRTDLDWAGAEVGTIALRSLPGEGGFLSTSIRIAYKSPDVGNSLFVRLRAFLTRRKPTEADAAALAEAIRTVRSGADDVPLWQQLEAIRVEFEASIGTAEVPQLIWHLQDTADDFYVVEDGGTAVLKAPRHG
jgi:hypothetical protein